MKIYPGLIATAMIKYTILKAMEFILSNQSTAEHVQSAYLFENQWIAFIHCKKKANSQQYEYKG